MQEIRISSNQREKDSTGIFKFARIWEGEIMREIRIRSNAEENDRARRLEFARIWEGEILWGI